LEQAISLAERNPDTDSELLARALYWAGNLAVEQSEFERAHSYLTRSMEVAIAARDERRRVQAIQRLCDVEAYAGNHARARELNQEALEIYKRLGDQVGVARTVYTLGVLALDEGDNAEAVRWLEESILLNRSLKQHRAIGYSLHSLGEALTRQGHYDHAERLLGEALEIAEGLKHRRLVAFTIVAIGQVAIGRGDNERAAQLMSQALEGAAAIGDRLGTAVALEGAVGVAVLRGEHDKALKLAGAAERLREQLKAPMSAGEEHHLGAALSSARLSLGEQNANRARAAGRSMTLEQAIALTTA
jgi:ATP/maltotriose-dependent transcriptional regulator MalT